jgi:glutathione-regulated potassium-efflux system ancillary protein KefC
MSESLLLFLTILLAAAVTIVPASARLGLGSVIGYLCAGVLLGPEGLGWIDNPSEILHLAEFGVVLLLFLIGLELNPKRLWDLRRSIFGLGLLQLVLSSMLIGGGLVLLGWSFQHALVAGLGVSMSSTAIAMQMMGERGLKTHPLGKNGFSVLLFQDLAVIPILLLVSFLAVAPSEATTLPLWERIVRALAAIVGIVVAGRYLARPIFRWIAGSRIRELSIAVSLLIVIGISYLMYTVGLSMALGAFLAGVILAESEYRHELEANLEPFKGLLLGLFFLAVGMTIQLQLLTEQPLLIGGLLIGLLTLKIGVLWGLGRQFGLESRSSLLFALLLSQGGEFAFVLLSQAVTQGVLPDAEAALLNGVVTLSMLTTPLLVLGFDRFFAGSAPSEKRPGDVIEDEGHPVIIAGFGRMGQIIARLLHINKISSTVIDHNPEHIDRLRRFGYKAYYGDASQLPLLEAAGIAQARLLIITIDHPDTVNQLIQDVKRHYPTLPIAARARDRVHAYQLMDLGIQTFERETFGSALSLGQQALRMLGVPAYYAHRTALRFHRYDLEMVEKLYRVHRDERQIISQSREAREELEKLFVQDELALTQHDDDPWG